MRITEFPVSVFGKQEKFSDTITRGRVSVFYKGLNRNGSYISEEFAQKLISSAPYTPIKGIYDGDDYTDHGCERSEGRIYGVVPADPHFEWERRVDPDGVEREYACFDVLYYTALYEEAGAIAGHAQSMEIYGPSIQGQWEVRDGRKCYVFTEGCFLGLQALGANTEPCFEGASFFSCEDNIISLLQKYEKSTTLFQHQEQGGKEIMDKEFDVVVEDEVKDENAEPEVEVAAEPETVEEPAAEAEPEEEPTVEPVVDEPTGEPEGEPETTHSTDNEETEKFAALNTQIVELQQMIATLTSERDNAISSYAALKAERDELAAFKKGVVDNEKLALIATYAETLSEEIIESFTNTIDNYSLEDLDKELTYAQKKANPNLFGKSKANPEPALIPKEEPSLTGLASILAKYERK